MQLTEPLLSDDMPLISVSSLQGELLLPAREEQLLWLLPDVDSCSGRDTEQTKLLKGPLPKQELVLLPQRKLLNRSVNANWLLRELLPPKRELLFSPQRRELKPKRPK